MSSTPEFNGLARPRRHRSYPYRLPLGAFCCILIWFFAVFVYGNEGEPAPQSHSWATLPTQAAVATPFKIFDFTAGEMGTEQLKNKIAGAIHYYALVARSSDTTLAEVHLLLPDTLAFSELSQLIKISQAEQLHLAVGLEGQLIVSGQVK